MLRGSGHSEDHSKQSDPILQGAGDVGISILTDKRPSMLHHGPIKNGCNFFELPHPQAVPPILHHGDVFHQASHTKTPRASGQ